MLGCCGRGKTSTNAEERQTFELDGRIMDCLERLVTLYPGVPTVAILSSSGDVLKPPGCATMDVNGMDDVGCLAMVLLVSAQREGKPTNKGEEPVVLSEDVLVAIASLKKVALQMAMTLREADCPMISITGDTHAFSCHELSGYLLAIFVDVRGLEGDQLDLSIPDSQAAEVTQQLRTILQEHDHPAA